MHITIGDLATALAVHRATTVSYNMSLAFRLMSTDNVMNTFALLDVFPMFRIRMHVYTPVA
jgi:hypothetical protein